MTGGNLRGAALPDPQAATARALDRLRHYVEQETPSGDEARARALAATLAADLAAAGAAAERIDEPGWGAHVRARVPGREPGREPVVVLGHLDTVHPAGTLAQRPFRIAEGRAEGPGTYDMKAGLAVLVEALHTLAAAGTAPRRPVTILVTCDEESGTGASRPLIEETARGAAAVLVLEPPLPDGSAKTARKGVATYRIRALGRAAHAGVEPERGVSAIAELAHQILRALALADPARGTTVNVGVVRGGTAVNVVPAEAWAEVDVRFATAAELARVDRALLALEPVLPGARLEVTRPDPRPPLERTEGVLRLYHHARALARELGFELGEGATGGGSDGNWTAALGIPTLDGLGVRGGGAHAEDEHILIEDVPRRIALLARLLETL